MMIYVDEMKHGLMVLLRALANQLSMTLFDELRTKKHPGYVVDASYW